MPIDMLQVREKLNDFDFKSLFVDNLGRFLDGAPLKEVVDRSAGY